MYELFLTPGEKNNLILAIKFYAFNILITYFPLMVKLDKHFKNANNSAYIKTNPAMCV
jgi:hypothetical protein